MQRILVMRGGAVGDVILTLPAIGALRLAFPPARIDVLGDAKRLCLAHHSAYADAVVDAEQWEIYRLFGRETRVSKRLVSYLSEFDFILSYMPPPDAAFTDNIKRYCAGDVITWPPHPGDETHVTEHLLQPVQRYVTHLPPVEPRVYPGKEDRQAADRFWQSAGLPERGVLAVHPGSGGRYKLWPLEGWQQVLACAVEEGVPGILICGPAEEERGINPLLDTLSSSWKVLRNVSLPELAAILAKCEVFLGHDSGVTHLAAAVGTRALALFGPTDPRVWGPRSQRACVMSPVPPGPLALHNLPVATVTQTLRALLDDTFQFNPSDLGHTRLRLPA